MPNEFQKLAFELAARRTALRPGVPAQLRKVAFSLSDAAGRLGSLSLNTVVKAPVLVGAGAGALWTALDRMVGGGSVPEQEQLERIERFRTAARKIERELTTSKRTKSIPTRVIL